MLIIPLRTGDSEETRLPLLTILVVLACIVVHFTVTNTEAKLAFAYDPKIMNFGRMISAVFLHADLSHLIGNLFFFYCFSSSIEREISIRAYLATFLGFAIVTHISYSLLANEALPSLGLSGVVWGYMGLFLARFPFDRVKCFLWFLWIIRTVSLPSAVFVLGFLIMDIGAFRAHEPGVNHVAHFSGFFCGLLFIGFWGLLERDGASLSALESARRRRAKN